MCTIRVVSKSGNTIIATSVLSNDIIQIVDNQISSFTSNITIENVVCGTLMYIYNSDGLVPSFNHTCTQYLEHPDGYTSYIVPCLENGVELTVILEEDW